MKGFIVFFDILGYQRFLENNEAEPAVQQVLTILNGVAEISRKYLVSLEKEAGIKINGESEFHSINHLVFSDTIVLTMPIQDGIDEKTKHLKLAYICTYASYLFGKMFIYGLPLRGIIHEGTYFVDKACLAGKGIVEAYKAHNALDLSCLAYSEKLTESFDVLQKSKYKLTNADKYLIKYPVPLHDNIEKELYLCNWIIPLPEKERSFFTGNIDDLVINRFSAFSKGQDDIKAKNTTKSIQRILASF